LDIERCESPVTKMKMLQQLHTLFDPMGILIPFLITGKLLVQECWRLGLTWKDSVPQTLEDQWLKWEDQIDQLSDIKVKRVLIPGENPENAKRELHIFVDASQDVYSAVAYMRNDTNTGVELRFVQAKSRLRPIKAAFTIPRMELLAAEMGLALAKKLIVTIDIRHQDVYIWTDSRAVHDWLRVETRALQVFVKNRVLKIRQFLKLQKVLWVPGLQNPADAATRGLTVIKLLEAKSWLEGPEFLYQQESAWPQQPPEPGRDQTDILPETITGLKKIKIK
jgi:ribonuclease HI